jgi:hypothetical protein
MINGAAGISTTDHEELRELLRTFPDQRSVDRLRSLGVRSVVVIRERVMGSPFEPVLNAAPGPGVTRQDIGSDVLFTLE